MRLVAVVALVAGCSDPSTEIVGPYTGPMQRFVVDQFKVPRDATEAEAFAADLDGDGKSDNKFGYATAVLAGTNDLSTYAADMIAAGSLASTVTIQADSLADDDRVGVTFDSAGSPTVLGGRFVAGTLVTNRTRDATHPFSVEVRLPVFTNADPVWLLVDQMEIELTPDSAGGFDASVRGVINEHIAGGAAQSGLVQMIQTEPERHLVFERGIDEDHDDAISLAEIENSIIGLLLTPDIEIAGNSSGYVSIGFGIHLTPCAEGTCSTVPPQNTCRDRALDAGETDVDCGGPCQRCADGLLCSAPADCQSNACDAGKCRAAFCYDGVRDGLESDVDCGDTCALCPTGKACAADRDCAGNNCDNTAELGSCH